MEQEIELNLEYGAYAVIVTNPQCSELWSLLAFIQWKFEFNFISIFAIIFTLNGEWEMDLLLCKVFKMLNVECKRTKTFQTQIERTQKPKWFRMIGLGTNDVRKMGRNFIFLIKNIVQISPFQIANELT